MPEIHLIARNGLNVHSVRGAEGEWESGDWVVSDEKATALVGGDIYLHEAQAEPAYFGGTILSFRRLAEGDAAGRVVFRFRASPTHKGNRSPGGWMHEKKLV